MEQPEKNSSYINKKLEIKTDSKHEEIFSLEDAYLTDFIDWALTDMPTLNGKILRQEIDPSILETPIQRLVTTFPDLAKLNEQQKRKGLGLLGFAISSIERHAQDRKEKPGEALSRIQGAEPLLIKLGEDLGHPPRDSLYTFALWNTDEKVVTFTGDRQEELFIDIVTKSTNQIADAVALTRTILKRDISLDDPKVVEILASARKKILEARDQFFRYAERQSDGQKAFTPEFFLDVMRQYNCGWIINGEEWGPPSAANCVPQMELDYMLGLADDRYKVHVTSRFKYFTTEDQNILKNDMQSPTFLNLVEHKLGIESNQTASLSEEQLIVLLSSQLEQNIGVIKGYIDLVDSVAKMSATHWSLIQNYMVKPMKARDKAQQVGAVDNTKGASGMEFSELEHFREMRRRSLQLATLADAVVKLGRRKT